MATSSCKKINRIELEITGDVTSGDCSFIAVITPKNNGKLTT